MTSEAIRDPIKDHLLTPKNSALLVIDYQPVQVNSIASMDRQLLVNNIVGAAVRIPRSSFSHIETVASGRRVAAAVA